MKTLTWLPTGLLVGLLSTLAPTPSPAQAPPDEGVFEGDTYDGEWVDEQAAAEPWSPEEQPPAEVDVNYFFDKLAPYGEWIWTPDYGWVWKPSRTPADWQPYTNGQWEYTEAGWTWVSAFPWGWAPFHYGRWAYLDHIAWVWVPGTVWGPAWVTWRYSGLYVGWSPLLAGFDWWYGWSYYPVYYSYWTFVDWGHFCHHHIHRHAIGRSRIRDVFRHTSYPRRCRDAAGPACNRGPAHAVVERVTHSRVPVRSIQNLAANAHGLRKARPDPAKLGLAGDQVRIYRPQLSPATGQRDPSTGTNGRAIRPTVDLGTLRPVRPVDTTGARPAPGAVRGSDGPYSRLPDSGRRPLPGATILPQRPNRPSLGPNGGGQQPMPTVRTPGTHPTYGPASQPPGVRPAQPSGVHPAPTTRPAPSFQRPSRSMSPQPAPSARPSPTRSPSTNRPASSSRPSPNMSSRSSSSSSSRSSSSGLHSSSSGSHSSSSGSHSSSDRSSSSSSSRRR